jgi:hypothetical protein
MCSVRLFNEIEGKSPPAECEKGGPSKAATKAELIQYLRDLFGYQRNALENRPRRSGAWANSRMAVPALSLNREHVLSQHARSIRASSSGRWDPTTSFSPPASVTRTPRPPLAT